MEIKTPPWAGEGGGGIMFTCSYTSTITTDVKFCL